MPKGVVPTERIAVLVGVLLHRTAICETGLAGIRFSRIPLAAVLRNRMMPKRAELLARPCKMRSRSVERGAKAEGLTLASRDRRKYAASTEVDGTALLKAMVDEQVDFRSRECRRDGGGG